MENNQVKATTARPEENFLSHRNASGEATKVSTLLSTQGAQSFINYQDKHGATRRFFEARNGHAAVTNSSLKLAITLIFGRRMGAASSGRLGQDVGMRS
jgi:hypothetical protein